MFTCGLDVYRRYSFDLYCYKEFRLRFVNWLRHCPFHCYEWIPYEEYFGQIPVELRHLNNVPTKWYVLSKHKIELCCVSWSKYLHLLVVIIVIPSIKWNNWIYPTWMWIDNCDQQLLPIEINIQTMNISDTNNRNMKYRANTHRITVRLPKFCWQNSLIARWKSVRSNPGLIFRMKIFTETLLCLTLAVNCIGPAMG